MTVLSTVSVALENVTKAYSSGSGAVTALRDVSLAISTGSFAAIVGPSGCGKSTLLNLIAGLDEPTAGVVRLMGACLNDLSDDARCDLRLKSVGIVFQAYNLFPTMTVMQNVALPLELQGVESHDAVARAATILAEVDIDVAAHGRVPAELSGGEQQRVALARALVTNPNILLADEPTGSLDSHTGRVVLELIRDLNARRQLTVIVATHSAQTAGFAHRTIELLDGRLVGDSPRVLETRHA